jgi:tRNA (mo5U34)-methyltransferase
MTVTDLAERVAAHRWYHSIDLGGGIVTRGIDDTPLRLARLALPASLEGLTVLDIGAWDGFFSFECERRGAARVVATDYYSTARAGARRPASSWRARRSDRMSRTWTST